MSNNPLISVIITTFSRSNTLKQAIESVLAQSYQSYELIVVDDNGINSPNQLESEKLVNSFNKAIKYIKHDINLGGNAARNSGIRASRGDLIAFLDDDDTFKKNNLEEKVKCFNLHHEKSVLIFSNYHVKGQKIGLTSFNFFSNITSEYCFPDNKKIFCGNYIGSFSFIIVDRLSLIGIGLLDEKLKSSQDWDLYVRLASVGVSFIGVNKKLVNYRFADNHYQISKDRNSRLSGYLVIFEKHKSKIKNLPRPIQKSFYIYIYKNISQVSPYTSIKILNQAKHKKLITNPMEYLYLILYPHLRKLFYYISE